MKLSEAKKVVYRHLAEIIEAEVDSIPTWLLVDDDGDDLTPTATARMQRAADEILMEIRKRADA